MITIDTLDHNPIISEYDNGNCHIILYRDGTKVRNCDGVPQPVLPESIDLKITNYCDIGCPFCHEGSSIKGKHAGMDTIFNIFGQLQPGTEIAMGGGNPLSHPRLTPLLYDAADCDLISNITVRLESVIKDHKETAINKYRHNNLIYGVGISGALEYRPMIEESLTLIDNNTTLHFIVGVDNPQDVLKIAKEHKVLILGYKQIGRGKEYYPNVKNKIAEWQYWTPAILARTNSIVSFDNLAIEQLNVRSLVSPSDWDKYYMGGEGEFTMYIDAVDGKYAVSSADERWPIGKKTVKEMFNDVRTKSGYSVS